MNPKKRSFFAFGLLLGSYALLSFIYVLPAYGSFMAMNASAVLYFIPAVSITLFFASSIIDRRVRNYLVAIGILIIFWFVLRAAKYVAFAQTEGISRFIWYLYYIPMLMIPLLSFHAALYTGESEDKKAVFVTAVTSIITVICILFVLTNDLHQLVFSFKPNLIDWNDDYTHKPIYYIIAVWDALLFFFSTALLFRKCRLSASRKLTWMPVAYLFLGVFMLYLLGTDNLPRVWGKTIGEFPEIACYMLGGFWVLCITIGLIPSNHGYGKLFQKASIAASIADFSLNVVYQSQSAAELTKEQLSAEEPVAINENTLVYRKPVTGGYTYWQVDITELSRINRELKNNGERIAEENEMIRQANELKRRQAQIDAKSRVFDEIAVRVFPQSQKIAFLSEEARNDNSKFERNMRLISIYAVYIKRLSNMMLMSQTDNIRKSELALALSESVRYLNKAGIPAQISCIPDETPVVSKKLISVYEQFEILLEQALPDLQALQISMTENVLKLTFEGVALTVPENITGTAETDDDITFVRLFIGKDGDIR
ncbi:MAG: hypothetical protein MJ177_04260 [Clostridia bacterium]|nr:hypothetical protein [Clostridia bacterium]